MSFTSIITPLLWPVSGLRQLFRQQHNWWANNKVYGSSGGLFKKQIRVGKKGQGKVYILGAGPGDPELLTLKAYRLLQQADVVLFDWLVSKELLDLIPQQTMRQFVGKRCGQHACPQETICNLMQSHASLGRTVVRLKGGDPSIFGRVSEECMALEKASIPFAIVPGVTAASGMAAYTGMPLTDRRYAQSVRFITATMKDPSLEPDWSKLVAEPGTKTGQDTLVFYMGLQRIGKISQRLVDHGMPRDMPVAVVDQATTSAQRVVPGTLSNIAEEVAAAQLQGPALLVVGQVTAQPFMVDLGMLNHACQTSAIA